MESFNQIRSCYDQIAPVQDTHRLREGLYSVHSKNMAYAKNEIG